MSERRPPAVHRRIALIGALLLVLVAAKLLSVGWFSSAAASAYQDGQYRISEADYRKLLVLNVAERWKAPNNVGVTQYRQTDYVGAERSFGQALDLAPQRCDVRYNLVISIEAQADILANEGEAAEAKKLYARALEVIRDGDCPIEPPQESTTTTAPPNNTSESPSEPQESPGEKLDEAEQRIDDKRQGGSSTSTTTGSSPQSTTGTTTAPQLPTESQQRQLEERGQKAIQERRENQTDPRDYPADRPYDSPRW